MKASADQLRQWLARFEAVEQRDREAERARGPRTEWAIAVALSMCQASGPRRPDPHREEEDERVRAIWDRLRQALGPAA